MSIGPKEHYSLLLHSFRAHGVKIIHRNLKIAGGLYSPSTETIIIPIAYRDTIIGCYLLAHEWSHYKQHRSGEYKEFFNLPNKKMEFNEELFTMIMEAEMAAVKNAYRLLKSFNIDYKPDELTVKGHIAAKLFWRNYYFKN